MTIEEKAKAYEEAYKRVAIRFGSNVADELFPEFKESEDERIRKELIRETKGSEVRLFETVTNDEFVSWLEKQGEQKPAMVEPKFKVGDIIRLKDGDGLEWTVEEVLNNGYYTIVCADRDDFIQLDDKWELVGQKPTWSEEDEKIGKWLIRLLSRMQYHHCDKDRKIGNKAISWLKSLKDRVLPQSKQEWSEEDETHINDIIDYLLDYKLLILEEDMNVANGVQKELDWLELLKENM